MYVQKTRTTKHHQNTQIAVSRTHTQKRKIHGVLEYNSRGNKGQKKRRKKKAVIGSGFQKMVQMFAGRIVLQHSQQGGDSHDDRQAPVADKDMKKKKKNIFDNYQCLLKQIFLL